MRIFDQHSIDRSLDYQLIDCGNGILEIYALGLKKYSLPLGEPAIRKLEKQIVAMNDYQAQELVQTCYDNSLRLREQRQNQARTLSLVRRSLL
jgi:hypothetical protein